MSAVKFSDIQDGLRNIAFYFFAEAISENKLETFKELVKATNGFVYKQFGNEKEISQPEEVNGLEKITVYNPPPSKIEAEVQTPVDEPPPVEEEYTLEGTPPPAPKPPPRVWK